MGITGVNIYAATIIVYIIAGIADKRSSNLQYDESRVSKPASWNQMKQRRIVARPTATRASATKRISIVHLITI